MNRLVLTSTLLLCVLSALAQWDSRATVEVSFGGSMPMGDFAYSKTNYEGSGFAKNGIALGLEFNYRVNGHLGLVASVSEYLLGVDERSIAMKYWDPGSGLYMRVDAAPWRSDALMGGLDIILPIYLSDFSFRLMGGLARTRLPGLKGTAYDFQREATTDLASAWGAGAGLTFHNFEKITLSFRLDFFATNPVLDEIWTSDLGSGSGEIAQNIAIVSLSAGLGFRIF